MEVLWYGKLISVHKMHTQMMKRMNRVKERNEYICTGFRWCVPVWPDHKIVLPAAIDGSAERGAIVPVRRRGITYCMWVNRTTDCTRKRRKWKNSKNAFFSSSLVLEVRCSQTKPTRLLMCVCVYVYVCVCPQLSSTSSWLGGGQRTLCG